MLRKKKETTETRIKMTKLTSVRVTLVMLQLTSMTIASIIIIIYYNPWIGRIIDEAERSGNTGRTLVNQIRRTENEDLVIFLMSSTTILVSLLGIIGALRNYEHNHCLLNFYMSTLIIFLFVVFVALCGTIWEVFGKLHRSTILINTNPFHNDFAHKQQPNTNINNNTFITEFDELSKTLNRSGYVTSDDTMSRPFTLPTPTIKSSEATTNAQSSSSQQVTWWYIGKSILLISFAACLYATSLKLTRKILESSDDRYLSANECDAEDDDLNSEGRLPGNGIITYPYHATDSSSYPYHFNGGTKTEIYSSHNMIGSSKSSLGSQFRTIL